MLEIKFMLLKLIPSKQNNLCCMLGRHMLLWLFRDLTKPNNSNGQSNHISLRNTIRRCMVFIIDNTLDIG